jgi:hypothetical protein
MFDATPHQKVSANTAGSPDCLFTLAYWRRPLPEIGGFWMICRLVVAGYG